MDFRTQLKNLNLQLEQGQLPNELNFANPIQTMDINEFKYNTFYRSYEFAESKFPNGVYSIPGMELVIKSIADKWEQNNITPLSEILERAQIVK
jgi:hypothetical protein